MHSRDISCVRSYYYLRLLFSILVCISTIHKLITFSFAVELSKKVIVPQQSEQTPIYYAIEALPNPIGKITDMYLLDAKVDSLFTPLPQIHYSFLSGGMWLRFSVDGYSIYNQHLFLNLGSYSAFPITIYRSTFADSRLTFEKVGTYESSRINLQTADLRQDAIYTYYISLPTIPSPLFAPIIENGNSDTANIVSIIQILCFSLILISTIFSLLRAILQKKTLFLLSPLFSSCILITLLFGVPNTLHGFISAESLPTMLSAILAVAIFPLFPLFALIRNGEVIPKVQKGIAFIIILCSCTFALLPLIPTMAFISRYFSFWPLLFLFSLPIALYTLQQSYTNALLYLIACITPTATLGITAIFSFLSIDSFFYVEIFPIIGLTISVASITLFKIPFTYSYTDDKKYKQQEPLYSPEEITPYWMNTTEEKATLDESYHEHYTEEEQKVEEEYEIPSTVKERVVQAMNREPNIIPYSPRELFVYLYRALKKYSESYNVELSWFVDPDLDENQEHDSDVIYNTLYSIGESLIINNPNSSVHISAKKITDIKLPSHIRFSITITPENTLHNFNSNSIANIAELIALAGGTLFMGNAQGKKMEMIITLPALAKLINTATTPKEQEKDYKVINKQTEELGHVISQELDAYEESHNPLLQDLEDAVENILPTEDIIIPQEEVQPIHEEEKEEEHQEERNLLREEINSDEEVHDEELEEQQALEELRNELERLTQEEENPIDPEKELFNTPVGEINILGDSDSIYKEVEEESPSVSFLPPITKMPLPKVDSHGNEIQYHSLEPHNETPSLAYEKEDQNSEEETTPLPMEEGVHEENIERDDEEVHIEMDMHPIPEVLSPYEEEAPLAEDVLPEAYEPTTPIHTTELPLMEALPEEREEQNIALPSSDSEAIEHPTDISEQIIEEPVNQLETTLAPSPQPLQDDSVSLENYPLTPASEHQKIIMEKESSNRIMLYNDSVDISHFIDDVHFSSQEKPINSSNENPFLLTNEMVIEVNDNKEIAPQETFLENTASFTASIRSSMQELLDARTEAEWEDITPVFSDRSSVLIMDTDANNRRLLFYFLEGLDYTIADVDNTQALLKQHARYPAHLIVLDVDSLDMPLTDVVTELHKIDARYQEVPVMIIALSNNQNSDIMNSGVVATLTKPVNHMEFRSLLLKLLPERVVRSGRTAPQWAMEDDIAPMDFNKVTIAPIAPQETSPSQPVAPVQPQQEEQKGATPLHSSPEQKILHTVQKEINALPEYLYPTIPQFLTLLRQHMNMAETALRVRDYYKIIDIANKIATESNRFSLSSMEKIALCIERAASESDDSAINMLFEELANTMDAAVSLLVQCYEENITT